MFGHLSAALTTARDRALRSFLSPNEKEQFIDKSDLGANSAHSVQRVEGLSAFGGSPKQAENNLYLTKAFAYAPLPPWSNFPLDNFHQGTSPISRRSIFSRRILRHSDCMTLTSWRSGRRSSRTWLLREFRRW